MAGPSPQRSGVRALMSTWKYPFRREYFFGVLIQENAFTDSIIFWLNENQIRCFSDRISEFGRKDSQESATVHNTHLQMELRPIWNCLETVRGWSSGAERGIQFDPANPLEQLHWVVVSARRQLAPTSPRAWQSLSNTHTVEGGSWS